MNEITYNATYTGAQFHLAKGPYEYKCIRGPVGCLPWDTEVMTRRGWVRISEYGGGEILEWDSENGSCVFRKPKRYISELCDEMILFERGNGKFTMEVTANHRVPVYDWRGRFAVKSAAELAEHPSKNEIPAHWHGSSVSGVGIAPLMLRLWVAIAADGYYPLRGRQCVFCLRRERKVVRLRWLLAKLGIEYKETIRERKDGAKETIITFGRPDLPKHFDWRLAAASEEQAAAVIDEQSYWDGLYASGYDRWDGTNKTEAEIIQYLAHCCGRRATISHYTDKRKASWTENYSVHIARRGSPKNRLMMRSDNTKVGVFKPDDGKQYCFETTSGFFVVRQGGNIFITGNSGKSVACCWDIRLKAEEQKVAVVHENGIRKELRWTKWLIGRHTYPALIKTTIETWLQWFPQTQMRYSPTISGRLEEPSIKNDGTIVRIDLEFYAMESKNIINDLMSLELSGAWINEATQIPFKTIDAAHGRIGRFQPVKGVSLDSFGVIMDTNSPDETNWWYRKEMVEKPQGWLFFVQPPALLKRKDEDGRLIYVDNDGRDFATKGIRPAENVENLKEGFYYWHKQTFGADPDKVKRLILNEFGTSVEGRPVYPEYSDAMHYTNRELPVQPGMTLLMGSDFGRTPATVIAQMGIDGVLYVLEEITAENMSAEQFIEEKVRPVLIERYGWPACKHINFGDPAGKNFNEVVSVSAIETWNRYGIRTISCDKVSEDAAIKGNRIEIRINTVSELLRRSYKGKAQLQISSRCPMLRKGFNGYYAYRRMRTGTDGDERYTDEPDKNKYSHIHDAFQYLCVGVFKGGVDYASPSGIGQKSENYADFVTDFDCL